MQGTITARRIKSSLNVWGKMLTNQNRIHEDNKSRLNLSPSSEDVVVLFVI